MGRHRDRSVFSGGGVVERSLVAPSGSFVEGAGPCVAGDYCEPRIAVSVRSDLALGLIHQDIGDSSPSMESRDVHLLDLIVNDHDEASDGSVDDGHCRVASPSRRPGPERVLSPCLDQFLRDKAEVAVLPTELPDLGDVACILRPGSAKRHSWTVRDHRPNVPAQRPLAASKRPVSGSVVLRRPGVAPSRRGARPAAPSGS